MVDVTPGHARAFLVGRDRIERMQIVGAAFSVAGTLGLLLVLAQSNALSLPSWVFLGLLGIGLSVPSLANGYRCGGVGVSWMASGVGAFPAALAFAPSGPFTPTLGTILVKAMGSTVVLALLAGSLFHAVGSALRRVRAGDE